MSALGMFITEYLAASAGSSFVKQLIVILAIFVLGAVLTNRLLEDISWQLRSVLIFPTGLSAFVITAYAMIVTSIPYNRWTVSVIMLAEALAAVLSNRRSYSGDALSSYGKHMAVTVAAAAVLAAFATSGITPVSISNDTMYFFRRYPDSIVYFEGLRDQFDFWMTDTGLGTVSVDTLPALFGFSESFGIREFFHIGFVAFFGICVYERASKRLEKKAAVAAAVLITLFLETATPFVILGHWALANMYFMEMFFIAAYSATDHENSTGRVTPLLLVALSLFRIEGTMFVVWLILCIALYTDAGKKLAAYCLLPMTLLFGGYCLNVFVRFYVLDDIYLFLTPVKAVLLVAAMASAGIYLAFIFPRLGAGIRRRLPLIYTGALLLGNAVLFTRDPGLYLGNIMAFYSNLFRQSGWGMLPYFVIAMTFLAIVEYMLAYFGKESRFDGPDPFTLTLTAGFILMVLAASYGRGDILAEDVGDSGNRVLLQVVPLVVMLFGDMFTKISSCGKTDINEE